MINIQDSQTDQEAYCELSYYTLSLRDPAFIHQYIVDAYAAQTATDQTKPIKVTFALAGLYLHLVKNFSGREVQLAHIQMAKKRKNWPNFLLPQSRGDIKVSDVLKASPENRNDMIEKWCVSVWDSYANIHTDIKKLVHEVLDL